MFSKTKIGNKDYDKSITQRETLETLLVSVNICKKPEKNSPS